MNKLLLFATCICAINAVAQPVIQNGNNIPSAGLSVPVSIAVINSSGIGNAGANQTWDFSSLGFSTAGNLNVIEPASAPMGASFPAANYAFSFSGSHSFFNASATKMEVQAFTIVQAGQGNDYTPNPRTTLKFPFNFNDSEIDTWQKVGGSENSVTITYDGYGTFITPSGTYSNVVRVKEDYGSGGIDYQWYILNPLMPIAIFDHNLNVMYHIATTQILDVSEVNSWKSNIEVYPNPAVNQVTVNNVPNGATLKICDLTGKTLQSFNAFQPQIIVNTDDLVNGIYFIQVEKNGAIESKKIVVLK